MTELKPTITKIYIESASKQTGNVFTKTWIAPFEFNIIAEFSRSQDYICEWDDYYSFVCEVKENGENDSIIKFVGQNKRCPNPCKMRVLSGNSESRVVFRCRVETPGDYTAIINGYETEFKVR